MIATHRRIGDGEARQFAQLFYRGLVGGASISEAMERAKTAMDVSFPDRFRGAGFSTTKGEKIEQFPWQLFADGPHDWRLPLTAKRLTPIPSIDLEKEFFGREDDLQRLAETIQPPRFVTGIWLRFAWIWQVMTSHVRIWKRRWSFSNRSLDKSTPTQKACVPGRRGWMNWSMGRSDLLIVLSLVY